MGSISILAQATINTAVTVEEVDEIFGPVAFIWEQITALTWLQAIIAVSFGVVYLLYGWRIFKALATISFGLVGLRAGIMIGDGFFDNPLWGGVLGTIILAVISIPLMRWAVSALGAIAGGILTGGIWYACGLSEDYILAGVLVGIIAGGLISFIVFKVSVMLFTSLGGSALIVVGVLSLWYQYPTEGGTNYVQDLILYNKWFLPIMLLVPTLIGILVQNKLIKTSHKWEL